jgi:hypothetical protein
MSNKPNKVTVEAFAFEERNYTLPQDYEYFGHGVIKEKSTRMMVYVLGINKATGIKSLFAFNAEEHYPLYHIEIA